MADIAAFLVGRHIGEQEGLPEERSNELGLLGALMGLNPMTVLAIQMIAQAEAPPPPVRTPEHKLTDSSGHQKAELVGATGKGTK